MADLQHSVPKPPDSTMWQYPHSERIHEDRAVEKKNAKLDRKTVRTLNAAYEKMMPLFWPIAGANVKKIWDSGARKPQGRVFEPPRKLYF